MRNPDRRTLLAGIAASGAVGVSGCIGDSQPGGRNGLNPSEDSNANDNPITPSAGSLEALGEDCGLAAQPLSARLTDDVGEQSACFEEATPSIAIENEREDDLTVGVECDGEDALATAFSLRAGERIVERNAFDEAADQTCTVVIDDEESRLAWPERSCYRHGIALTPAGIEIGWIEPFAGPGDTQHDCYAGDAATVTVRSVGTARTIEVTSYDRCLDEQATDRFEVGADEVERSMDLIETGGIYDVDVAVEDAGSAKYEFHEACRGIEITVGEDGGIEIREMDID